MIEGNTLIDTGKIEIDEISGQPIFDVAIRNNDIHDTSVEVERIVGLEITDNRFYSDLALE